MLTEKLVSIYATSPHSNYFWTTTHKSWVPVCTLRDQWHVMNGTLIHSTFSQNGSQPKKLVHCIKHEVIKVNILNLQCLATYAQYSTQCTMFVGRSHLLTTSLYLNHVNITSNHVTAIINSKYCAYLRWSSFSAQLMLLTKQLSPSTDQGRPWV